VNLPDDVVELAALVLGRRRQTLQGFRLSEDLDCPGQRIRVHGDYHLGQLLRVKSEYVILDFEGEPARPLEERRAKHSPLKDVAGMLRPLSYAAYSSLSTYTARRPEDYEKLEPWARLWERATGAEFLRAYRDSTAHAAFLPGSEKDFREVLNLYWIDKVLYELSYELNNRPAWLRIPLMGVLMLPREAGGREWNWMASRSQHQ